MTEPDLTDKVLVVTGASGFLGRHFVDYARSRGAKVRPLVRERRDASDPEGARTVFEALKRPELLEGDAVVHLAAVRHRYGTSAAAYAEANCGLVESLLRASAGQTRRFVHVSSVGVYGFPQDLPITEAHRYAPVTTYSESKVEAEKLVRRLAPELGVPFVIVRPTITYGPNDRNGMLDKLVHMVRARRYLLVGQGKNRLHHTHVDDFNQGLGLACTKKEALGEDFIFCGPEETTLGELSELVAEETRRRLPPIHVPLILARPLASLVERVAATGALGDREPPLTQEKIDVMCVNTAFDCQKAKTRLGYAPKVGYREGIARTVNASGAGGESR